MDRKPTRSVKEGIAERFSAVAPLTTDIREAFPYLNATLRGTVYNAAAAALTWKKGGHNIAFHPYQIAVCNVSDREAAVQEMEGLIKLITRTWERRAEIEPDHELLARCVASSRREDEVVLELLRDDITRLLEQHGVNGTVQGQIKGLYGLYRKMCRQGCSASEVTDRIGLRIIVSSVKECYQVLDLLHARFRPVPGMFDD